MEGWVGWATAGGTTMDSFASATSIHILPVTGLGDGCENAVRRVLHM